MRVEDVAIPRAEIAAVPVDIELEGLIDMFRSSGFTRLPVYNGTMDSPAGMILHMKNAAMGVAGLSWATTRVPGGARGVLLKSNWP